MAIYSAASPADVALKPVLADSVAAIALPVFYAEQLHGVLYIESATAIDFSEEEILLLRTLADLICGRAAQCPYTFQKAQEQAITDGLTGVKTHRFFMEALSAEWKRSTRAGRAFALVLMDLDRFKFVNDFYGHLEGDLVLQRVGQILGEQLPALRRGFSLRRRRIRHSDAGNEYGACAATRQQAARLGFRRSAAAREEYQRQLWHRLLSAAWVDASGTHPGRRRVDVFSKHQGGNAVSTADHFDPNEAKKWKRDVLEAYLGVTLKRLFSTGPEAFEEIYSRLKQFTESLAATELTNDSSPRLPAQGPQALPQAVLDTVTSLAFAIDAKDHYTQGHSQKVSAYAALIAEGLGMNDLEVEEIRLGGVLHDIGKVAIPEAILNKSGPLNPDEWDTMKSHVMFRVENSGAAVAAGPHSGDGATPSRIFRWVRLS